MNQYLMTDALNFKNEAILYLLCITVFCFQCSNLRRVELGLDIKQANYGGFEKMK